MSSPNTTPPVEGEQGFITHLLELRNRLVRAFAAVAGVFALLCLWPGPARLFDVLAQPIMAQLPPGAHLQSIHVIDPFFIPIQVTLMTSFVLALPVVLYQTWAFVAPGLYSHEKRLALPIIISATALFAAGMAFCYYLVFGRVFHFIQQFAPASVVAAPDIQSYWSFVLTMFLSFGLAFELPVVLVTLVRLGFVQLEQLREVRRYAIVAAFVISAIVTPPDVISMLSLAIPLCVLYECGLYCARFVTPRPLAKADTTTASA